MKKLIISFLMFITLPAFAAQSTPACNEWINFFKPICHRINQIITEGSSDLYLSGYAWHNRYIYSQEKINSYNENAWGGGFGKGLFDEKGNWHGLFAIAFLDSHSQVEPAAGYAYLKVLHINNDLKAGIGYSVLVTSRVDINHNIPFPGAVPWFSVFFKKVAIAAAYIPGNSKNGNVLYVVSKYTF
jgi:lipid IVA palmitoyltransferase